MFLPESDNDSVPSPVKSHPTVPRCKTYEQIRLEEIQAESAAYYSYETDNLQAYRQTESNISPYNKKQFSLNSKIYKKESESKNLDFKVLTLEEIRRQKKQKEERIVNNTVSQDTSSSLSNPVDKTTSESIKFLENAIKTLTELKAVTSTNKLKRQHEQCCDDLTDERKIRRKCVESTELKVPPIKLRRFSKRSTTVTSAVEADSQQQQQEQRADDKRIITSTADDVNKASSMKRLENVNRMDEVVEVRMCDTTMDMSGTLTPSEVDRSSAGISEDVDRSTFYCDSPLDMNESEFLTIDNSEDNILNDINALLQDNSSV